MNVNYVALYLAVAKDTTNVVTLKYLKLSISAIASGVCNLMLRCYDQLPCPPFCRLPAMEQTVKQSTWREGFFLSSCTNKTLALFETSEQDSPWIEYEYPNYL